MRGRLIIGLGVLAMIGCQSAPRSTSRQAAPSAPGVEVADPAKSRHLVEGQKYLDQGQLDAAMASFGFAIEDNPKLAQAHLGMAHVFKARDQYDYASRAYERAAQIAPRLFEARYYFALMRQLAGHPHQAIASYLVALTLDPDHPQANRDLASAYLQVGQPDQALVYALRATELDDESQEAWCNLAAVYSWSGQHDQAVDCYRQAAELGSLPAEVLLGLTQAHLKLKHYQRAVNVLQTLAARQPSVAAYERLGYGLFRLKRFEEAQQAYARALELDRNDVPSLNGMGACLMTRYLVAGRVNFDLRDEARQYWRHSLKVKPHQQLIIDLLARYHTL